MGRQVSIEVTVGLNEQSGSHEDVLFFTSSDQRTHKTPEPWPSRSNVDEPEDGEDQLIIMSQSYDNFSDGRNLNLEYQQASEPLKMGSYDGQDEEDDLKKYHFQYKVRYENPQRFCNSERQLEEYLTTYQKQ